MFSSNDMVDLYVMVGAGWIEISGPFSIHYLWVAEVCRNSGKALCFVT